MKLCRWRRPPAARRWGRRVSKSSGISDLRILALAVFVAYVLGSLCISGCLKEISKEMWKSEISMEVYLTGT